MGVVLRPFRPPRARTLEEARTVGRLWAEHEANDPESLKGKPSERPDFFWFFDEAADYVLAPDMRTKRELAYALGAAATKRWSELAARADEDFAWATGQDEPGPQ
jgi:hypothetical protein